MRMKKILSLLALMMLCVVGAKAEKVIYQHPGTGANSITLAEGVTLQCTGNETKTLDPANNITVDGKKYKSIKLSNGAQNTLTLSKEASAITFYSYVNKDAATERSCYWKEVNGVAYDNATASGGELTSFKDGANPDVRTYTFSVPTKSITFTNAGEQLCFVIEVKYYEEKSIILDASNWRPSDARFAVYAFNSNEVYTWIDFQPTDTENNFTAKVSDIFANIILVRMNGTTTENNWDNKWNQTADIDFTAITDGTIFTVSFDDNNTVYTTSNPLQEAKDKLAKAIAMAEMLQSPALADAIAAAKEAQNSTDVTVIAGSMQTLYAVTKPVATSMLTELVTMADTYGYTELEGQIIALAQTLMGENPDMDAVATQLASLISQGRTAAQEILGKVASYTEVMGNEQLNTAIAAAAATAANETSSISEVMAAVNNGVAAFKTAAEAFVQQVAAENIPDENVQAKLAAIANLGENPSFAEYGEAIRQLIAAYQAYQLEQNPIYTVAGTTDLTGYDWDNTKNEMTKNEETGIYEWTAKLITVTNSQKPEFKIVRNANWDTTWPDNNWVITPESLDGEGVYTITITFDPNADEKITVTGVKRVAPEFAENNVYFWESPDGYQDQNGGVAVHNNGERVNYAQAGYYTICLNGNNSFSSDIVTITLDEGNTLEAGDQIAITAFRNKDATGKKSGARLKFDSGKTIDTGNGTEFVNINAAVAESDEYGTEPNTVTITAPETAEGSKTITMTRSQGGTNLFITKIDITRPAPTRVIADGDYYLMDAGTGQLVAGNALNKEGAPLTFTFDEAAGTYTIAGADIFNDVNWSVRSTGDGLTCFISAVINGVKKYVAAGTNNDVVLSDEPATWQPIPAESWEEMLSYNVAGTADLCGAEWNTTSNKMEKNNDGLYEWKAENITVNAENVPEFKIAVNNVADEDAIETVAWYPEGDNWKITPNYLGGEGVYNITITFNVETKEIGVTGEKTGEIVDPNDYTGYIVNADLTGTDGWDITGTKGYHSVGGVVTAGNNAQFDFMQIIKNLPAGQYKLTAQAAYRYGSDEATEAAAIADNTDTKLATLYATTGTTTETAKVLNRWDGASTTDYAEGDGSVIVNEKYVPNSTKAMKAWFTNGQYVNEVVFNHVADGDVTIGIVKTAQPEGGDYTVIGPWTLTRLGDAEVPVDDNLLANGDFEAGYSVYYSPKDDRDIYQPESWTVTYENGDVNDMTALNSDDKAWNNFSSRPQLGETGGKNTYWVRFRWGNSEKLTLSQQVTLPAGDYKLTADAFFNGADGASATISAGEESLSVAGNSTWDNYTLKFNLAEETAVTIALNVTQTKTVENVAAFDNFKLEAYDPSDVTITSVDLMSSKNWDEPTATFTVTDASTGYWTATDVNLKAEDEFKVRVSYSDDSYTWLAPESDGKFLLTEDLLGQVLTLKENTPNMYVDKDAKLSFSLNPAFTELTITGELTEPAVVLAEGKYFLYNVAAKGYVVGANNWGTRASISQYGGLEMEAKLNNGKYELSTAAVYPNKHLGFNGYVDNGDANQNWKLTPVEGQEGVFTMTTNDNKVLFWDGGEATTTSVGAMPATAENAYWKFVTREDREALFADATAENPVDATFYILNPNFGRESTNSMWNNSPTMAGDNENYNAQKYDTNFDVYQTLTGLKEGLYQLRLQGFYRQGGDGPSVAAAARSAGEERLLATYYAGEKENQLMSIFEEAGKLDAGSATDFGKVPNSQSDATKFLSAGYYENEPIEVSVVGGTLKIGVKKSEAISKDWTIFDNFRLFYTGPVPADELKGDWEAALAAAQAALDDEANSAVTGEERSALEQAISDNSTVEDNADAYRAAITALEEATVDFTGAKPAYEDLAAAKTALAALSYKYASAEKKAAAEAAAEAAATNADDAIAKKDALYVAYRQYAESSALLEGVETAVNFTDLIVNPKAEDGTNGWTKQGSLRTLDGEPWTDGEGNASHKYFDSDQWSNNSWDISLKQDIKLPKGKYQLTVNARANAEMKSFVVLAGDDETEMKHIGNQGGLFNRGWNDASVEFEMTEAGAITIGVEGVTETVHSWMSFSDFRLMKFEAYEPVYTVAGAVKANADAEEEASFFTTAWSPDANTVNEAEETIYLNDMDDEDGDGIYTISYEDVELVPGSTIYYKVAAEHTWNYLSWGFGNNNANYIVNLPEGESLSEGKEKGVFDITFMFNPTTPFENGYNVDCIVTYDAIATSINSIVAEAAENGQVYNLNGQKVLKPRKGLYIVNGKKIVNK